MAENCIVRGCQAIPVPGYLSCYAHLDRVEMRRILERAFPLLKEAADEMELECGANTTTDAIRAFLYELGK